MDTKLRLANLRWFWTVKRKLQQLQFQFLRRLFFIEFNAAEKRKNLGLVQSFFAVSFASFLIAVAAAWVLHELDNIFLVLPIQIKVPSEDRYLSFMLGVAQIGGVFIGLYYAGMTTVAGTIYAQTPSRIRNLLVRERTGGVYMAYLTFVTFVPLVLCVAAQTLNWSLPRLGVPVIGLLAGTGIIAFVQLGRKAFDLFDPTTLSIAAFDDLLYWTDQATARSHFWHNPSFQRYANRRATESIEVLQTLAEYSLKNENRQPQSLISLTSTILSYLSYYQAVKSSIPRQSMWYERKLSHPDWFRSPDSSVQIASRTGTTMQAQETPVEHWIEDKLEPLVIQCFRANAKTKDLPLLLNLSSLVTAYVASLASMGQVGRAVEFVREFVQLALSDELRKNVSKAELAGFTDFIAYLQIQILLSSSAGAKNRFPELHLTRIATISWDKDDSIYMSRFPAANLEQVEWLRSRILAEQEVEGKRVTPYWYCVDMLLLADCRYIRDIVPQLLDTETMFLKPARQLAKESPFASAALLSRCLEYLSKLDYHRQIFKQWYEAILATRKLSDLPWPVIDIEFWEERAAQGKISAHEEIAKIVPLIILAHKDDKLPDYRGQFIQEIGDDLLQRMIEGNAGVVEKAFPLFWVSSFALFDALRPSVSPDAQHLLENELHIASAPILDVMDLSGYALLLAEYHQNPNLWRPVEQVWKAYLQKVPAAMKQLSAMVNLEHLRFQIPHRAIIRSQWSILIHQLLSALPSHGARQFFGAQVEHPSAVVRYVARDNFRDGLSIFVWAFLATLPASEGLDWGFHNPKDFVKGVQRETERAERDRNETAE